MRRIAPSVNDPVKDAPWNVSFGLYQARRSEAQVDERYRMALQQGLLPRMACSSAGDGRARIKPGPCTRRSGLPDAVPAQSTWMRATCRPR